jgi:hypothetical protein
LDGPQKKILREEVVDYAMEGFEKELKKALHSMRSGLDSMHERKAQLEQEIGNLISGLATGVLSAAVMQAIADREREKSGITDRLLSAKADSIRSQIDKMSVLAKARLLYGDVAMWRKRGLRCCSTSRI